MTTVLHKSTTRGHANNGGLDSWHTFSFANYFDPQRMNFGLLRVLNDNTLAPGMYFADHPYSNLEMITIPLEGDLEHKDSMGNHQVIRKGNVQVVSAGEGVAHSGKNRNHDLMVRFLQVGIQPNKNNLPPSYGQRSFSPQEIKNRFQTIVSPRGSEEGVPVHQNAWLSFGALDKNVELVYTLKEQTNGVYAFLIEGDVTINTIVLNYRDGLGLTEVNSLNIKANIFSNLLLIEVPME